MAAIAAAAGVTDRSVKFCQKQMSIFVASI